MAAEPLRIFSDLHFGDRASHLSNLQQLAPLLEGVTHAVLNGDTLDTRPGPNPAHTADCRALVDAFFPQYVPRVTYVTGNHDADVSPHHTLDCAKGEVWVVHGDLFFENLVPWSQDAPLIEAMIAAERRHAARPVGEHLEDRLALFRRVAAALPQRHQAERNPLKYALHFLADTVWPPLRMVRMVRAWRQAPDLAASLSRRFRPQARFVVCGHTHRPGIWRQPNGVTVINTGSFCPPFGGSVVDVTETQLQVRAVRRRGGEFRVGDLLGAFPLAGR